MNRTAYMTELTQRLRHLPLSREDVEDALRFYEEFFDEAGPEQAQTVMAELGSPAYVAAQIALKLSTSPTPLTEKKPNADPDYTASDYTAPDYAAQNYATQDYATQDYATQDYATQNCAIPDYATQNYATPDYVKHEPTSRVKPDKKSGMKRDASVLKMVILGILAAPVALPLAIAGLSVVLALTISAAAIVFTFAVGGFACLSAGIAVGIAAVAQFPGDFATGLYFIGVALFSIGVGGLLAKLGFWIGRCFMKLATKIGACFFGKRHRRPHPVASSSTAPSSAVPSSTAPSSAVPSSAVPSSAASSSAVPSSTAPSSAVPSSAASSSAVPSTDYAVTGNGGLE